uniref:Uncharacterized protein n=1 Tax=Cannabis sativa TaxID=3483 RepID=A0A803PKT6_CANSA
MFGSRFLVSGLKFWSGLWFFVGPGPSHNLHAFIRVRSLVPGPVSGPSWCRGLSLSSSPSTGFSLISSGSVILKQGPSSVLVLGLGSRPGPRSRGRYLGSAWVGFDRSPAPGSQACFGSMFMSLSWSCSWVVISLLVSIPAFKSLGFEVGSACVPGSLLKDLGPFLIHVSFFVLECGSGLQMCPCHGSEASSRVWISVLVKSQLLVSGTSCVSGPNFKVTSLGSWDMFESSVSRVGPRPTDGPSLVRGSHVKCLDLGPIQCSAWVLVEVLLKSGRSLGPSRVRSLVLGLCPWFSDLVSGSKFWVLPRLGCALGLILIVVPKSCSMLLLEFKFWFGSQVPLGFDSSLGPNHGWVCPSPVLVRVAFCVWVQVLRLVLFLAPSPSVSVVVQVT